MVNTHAHMFQALNRCVAQVGLGLRSGAWVGKCGVGSTAVDRDGREQTAGEEALPHDCGQDEAVQRA